MPDWCDKHIYFVWYNEPRKHISLEEFKAQYGEGAEFDIINKYEKLPVHQLISYPEDDLELFK